LPPNGLSARQRTPAIRILAKDYLPRMRADGRLEVLTMPIIMRDQVEGILYVAHDESVLLRSS
jgi:hypothetical protein